MKTSTLKLWQAVLAALMFTAAAANLGDVLPGQVAEWFVLAVGAASAGTGWYTAHVGNTPADFGK